jgi:hypothetical protein
VNPEASHVSLRKLARLLEAAGLGRHEVAYRGRYDGEGTSLSQWSITEVRHSSFALTPESFMVPDDAPIQQIAPREG